ncbi:hypothetical protein [Streptomyces fragilis]|uniref:Uncharacterized protein n=1 Tax=Streptomyces fragilis TaxID=67301 RepID=A0ABV2YKP3_9ACTN|nr:hypothetical protein [Streptomyces fragilis]
MLHNAEVRESARSAAELNEMIRALWLRSSGAPTAQDRARYEQLVVEWAHAVRAEALQPA